MQVMPSLDDPHFLPHAVKPPMVNSFNVIHLTHGESGGHFPHHCVHCSSSLSLLSHCHGASWSPSDPLLRFRHKCDLWIPNLKYRTLWRFYFFALQLPNPMGMINLQLCKPSVRGWNICLPAGRQAYLWVVLTGDGPEFLLYKLLRDVIWQLARPAGVLSNTSVWTKGTYLSQS